MNACIKYKNENELKKIDIKNCACSFDCIINNTDVNFNNILLDKKL